MQHTTSLVFGRRNRSFAAISLVAALGAACASSVMAQELVFREGPVYRAVPAVASDQAQVVLLRKVDPTPNTSAVAKAAHVYINGSFNTALPPHSYTHFCVLPGTYSVEAYIGDAPLYEGKANPKSEVTLEGGKTYFAAVSDAGSGELVPYRRPELEKLLEGTREPHHVVNRAKEVVPCHEIERVLVPAPKQFTLNADVLFAFGKGDYASITPTGRDELRKIAGQIQAEGAAANSRVTVRGYADPLGSPAGNLKLSRLRAQSVTKTLVEGGVPADIIRSEGVGSAEPIVACPPGRPTPERIACNAPNRRVEIKLAPR